MMEYLARVEPERSYTRGEKLCHGQYQIIVNLLSEHGIAMSRCVKLNSYPYTNIQYLRK